MNLASGLESSPALFWVVLLASVGIGAWIGYSVMNGGRSIQPIGNDETKKASLIHQARLMLCHIDRLENFKSSEQIVNEVDLVRQDSSLLITSFFKEDSPDRSKVFLWVGSTKFLSEVRVLEVEPLVVS